MTAQRFLIAGLPRSRTAWLSVFATTGDSICYHDPLVGMSDVKELEAVYQSEFYKFVGVCDTGAGFFLDWILPTLAPRTLIIERDPKEVRDSMTALGLTVTQQQVNILADKLREFKEHPLVMWVPYEALNVKRVMQKVFWHLMPGHPFDEARYEQLTKMHIEVDMPKAFGEAEKYKRESAKLYRNIQPLMRAKANPDAQKLH